MNESPSHLTVEAGEEAGECCDLRWPARRRDACFDKEKADGARLQQDLLNSSVWFHCVGTLALGCVVEQGVDIIAWVQTPQLTDRCVTVSVFCKCDE